MLLPALSGTVKGSRSNEKDNGIARIVQSETEQVVTHILSDVLYWKPVCPIGRIKLG